MAKQEGLQAELSVTTDKPSSGALLKIGPWWRATLLLLGVGQLVYGAALSWRNVSPAAAVGFVVAGGIAVVLAAGGRFPASVKYGDAEVGFTEADEFVSRIADALDPAEMARVSANIRRGDSADPGQPELTRAISQFAEYSRTRVEVLQTAASRLGVALDQEVSGWDAAYRMRDRIVNFEIRYRLDEGAARRIVQRISASPRGEVVYVISLHAEQAAVRRLGRAGGRAIFVQDEVNADALVDLLAGALSYRDEDDLA